MIEPPAASWCRGERFPILGVAVDVRSLYNVGAIFRASDAARVRHLYLTGMSGHPASQAERIDKTALGCVEVVPWTYARDPLDVVRALQATGVRVAALELTPESRPLDTIQADDMPLALVVGHEVDGVPERILTACDLCVAITTYGRKPALNVALAYGVAILRLASVWAQAHPMETVDGQP